MYIETIELKNFRNYEDFSCGFDQNVNLIVGRNAQGKTNLIEGIYLSSIGRSFRTSHDSEMIRFGADRAHIRVKAQKSVIDTKIEITIDRSSKKQIRKDGSLVHKTSSLINNIIIVVFSPEDLRIVKDEPEKRRRFIDSQLAQIRPAYYSSNLGLCFCHCKRQPGLYWSNVYGCHPLFNSSCMYVSDIYKKMEAYQ